VTDKKNEPVAASSDEPQTEADDTSDNAVITIQAKATSEADEEEVGGVPATLFENRADLNSALAQLMEEAEEAVSHQDRDDRKVVSGRVPTQPLPIIQDNSNEEELIFLREQVETLNERLRLFQQDVERSKKRSDEQRQHLRSDLTASLLKNILPAFDTLYLAIEESQHVLEDYPNLTDLNTGLSMTANQLTQAFLAVGVETLNPKGIAFDPQFHEATESAPSDEHPPGTVMEVFQIGYRIGKRLVRPARVRVSIGSKEKATNLRDLEAVAEGSESND